MKLTDPDKEKKSVLGTLSYMEVAGDAARSDIMSNLYRIMHLKGFSTPLSLLFFSNVSAIFV